MHQGNVIGVSLHADADGFLLESEKIDIQEGKEETKRGEYLVDA